MAKITAARGLALANHDLVNLAGLLFEAGASLEHRLDQRLRASGGMPLATFEVLIRLLRTPGQRLGLSELGRDLVVTTGGVTRLIDRLEAESLVRRERDPGDRRVVFAQLTAEGRAAVLGVLEGHVHDLEEAIGGPLTPAQIRALGGALRSLRDGLTG
ncbi:MarR family transcriptional regulator [Acidothermaceae bacterium B102]|nr:MarR family transcriptional regulator [Acidothermaceae bacterium B102]